MTEKKDIFIFGIHLNILFIMKTKPLMMKTVLLVVFAVFNNFLSFSQTLYALKIDRKIRAEAIDITARYQPRLVMGSEQALQFQNTVARFLVKKKAVEEDETLSVKAKYELLKKLSSRETSEMADVLESYRWQEYIRIKNAIQPIEKPISNDEDLIVINPRDH